MGRSGNAQRQSIALRWALKFLVSFLVLSIVLWILPTDQVWKAVVRIPLWLWAGVLVAFLIGHLVAAAKWWLLVAAGTNVGFMTALKAHFAGLAANLCLPGVAGGDVIRGGIVFRSSNSKARVALGSITDRLLDSLTLLLLAGVGALLTFGAGALSTGPLLLVASFIAVTLLTCLLAAAVVVHLGKTGLLAKIAAAIQEFRRRPGRLAVCLLLSVLVQSGFVGLNIALATASGLEVPGQAWFFAWPLAKLMAIVPISLAGLGVREAGLAALMAPLGADPAKVVAVGLLWQAVLLVAGLLGGLMLLVTGKLRREVESTSSETRQSPLVA